MKMRFIEFTIVGLGKGGRKFHEFERTDEISLEKEPNNPVDKKAVKVLVSGEHVAYVSKEDLKLVRKYMKYKHWFYLIDRHPASIRTLMIIDR